MRSSSLQISTCYRVFLMFLNRPVLQSTNIMFKAETIPGFPKNCQKISPLSFYNIIRYNLNDTKKFWKEIKCVHGSVETNKMPVCFIRDSVTSTDKSSSLNCLNKHFVSSGSPFESLNPQLQKPKKTKFTIYINNICDNVTNAAFQFSADETIIYCSPSTVIYLLVIHYSCLNYSTTSELFISVAQQKPKTTIFVGTWRLSLYLCTYMSRTPSQRGLHLN